MTAFFVAMNVVCALAFAVNVGFYVRTGWRGNLIAAVFVALALAAQAAAFIFVEVPRMEWQREAPRVEWQRAVDGRIERGWQEW